MLIRTNPIITNEALGQLNSFTARSYPESGSKNESDLHWDMLCDMSDAEINMDGDLFYKKGRTVIQ